MLSDAYTFTLYICVYMCVFMLMFLISSFPYSRSISPKQQNCVCILYVYVFNFVIPKIKKYKSKTTKFGTTYDVMPDHKQRPNTITKIIVM